MPSIWPELLDSLGLSSGPLAKSVERTGHARTTAAVDDLDRRLHVCEALERGAHRAFAWLRPATAGSFAVADTDGVALVVENSARTRSDAYLAGVHLFEPEDVRSMREGRPLVCWNPDVRTYDVAIPIVTSEGVFSGVLASRWSDGDPTTADAALLALLAAVLMQGVDLAAAKSHTTRIAATIGHELRQPLSALMMALDLIGRTTPHTPGRALDIARRQTAVLVKQVDSLLDVSRLASGRVRITLRLSDIARVVAAAIESVRGDIERKQQTLHVAITPKMMWGRIDGDRLQQAIVNLLANANRYTPAGGVITVMSRMDGESVVIEVSDSGPGIEPAQREHIFAAFAQGSAGSPQGLGLGLAIARGIVESHRGSLTADDGPAGRGATFRIRLPGLLAHTREVSEAVCRTREEIRPVIERTRTVRRAQASELGS